VPIPDDATLQPPAECLRVDANVVGFVRGGENEVVEAVDHRVFKAP
jgi:hypothetical protein